MNTTQLLAERIRGGDWVRRIGRIVRFVGLTLESTGPDARVGEICEIHARGGRGVTLAEVVGFSEERVLLMPFGDLQDARRAPVTDHFRSRVLPVLTPLAIDSARPFPLLSSLSLNIAVRLAAEGED